MRGEGEKKIEGALTPRDATNRDAQHTPGPWRVAPASHYTKTAINIDAGEAGTGGFICEVGQRGDPVAEADARLIAAAPELLEALRKMFRALNSDAKSGPQKSIVGDGVIYHLDGQAMYHAINACRDTIAKATQPPAKAGEANQ